nr:retinol dehydrogenase 8-like isoform X1 [Zootoca vivipara]
MGKRQPFRCCWTPTPSGPAIHWPGMIGEGELLKDYLRISQLSVSAVPFLSLNTKGAAQNKIFCLPVAVNNAGVGLIGPIECQTIEEMKAIMETNFFGAVRMIKEVLPDMKKRRSGHIVVISSVMGLQGIMFNDIYTASKFAIEGFCESLIIQALKFNIFVSLIEPGPVVTEFEMKVYEDAEKADFSQTDPETAEIFTNVYLKNSKVLFSSLGQTPEDIAEHTLKVITTAKPPFRHQTNAIYTPMMALKHADPTGALMTDSFYKMIFKYDTLLHVSLKAIRLIRWQARKMRQGARLLGFR